MDSIEVKIGLHSIISYWNAFDFQIILVNYGQKSFFGYPRVFVFVSVRFRVLPDIENLLRVASGNTIFGSGFRVIGYPCTP